MNRRLLTRACNRLPRTARRRVAITTLPIVADLVGRLPVDRWIYYCVDDLSRWPGLDRQTLESMEGELVAKVDEIVAVSPRLVERMNAFGRRADLLTHGVDLDHWRAGDRTLPASFERLERPLVVFWGVVDRRLDLECLERLGRKLGSGSIVLVGPANNPSPALDSLPRLHRLGAVPYADLPAVANAASVLVMPYADMGATRAMQPLKLKEYLATGKPVVTTCLPAVAEWRDSCDVADSPAEFADLVAERLATGVPQRQVRDRRRLSQESWSRKAEAFGQLLTEPVSIHPRLSGPLPLVLHTRVVTAVGGGPDKTILNSPRFLANGGYRGICAYLRPPSDPGFAELEARARAWSAPLVALDDNGPFDWRVVARCHEICQELRPRIWHGHDYKSNLLGLLARRRHPMVLVTTVHGWGVKSRRTPLYYAVDRWCLRRYDEVLCVSSDLFAACQRLGVADERLTLIPNAIDTGEFRRTLDLATGKRRVGADPDRFLIGAVGRLSEEKAFDLQILAVDQLLRDGLDVELWIVGEGDDRDRLAELIRRLGRGDRIRLLGYRSDTLDLYQALDAFVISSLREGLPNVLLEAMAVGLPVVGTRAGDVAKVVAHGETGLLLGSSSRDDLASNLRHLIDDPELARRLGRAARQVIEESFSFESRMRNVCAIYERALTRKRRA